MRQIRIDRFGLVILFSILFFALCFGATKSALTSLLLTFCVEAILIYSLLDWIAPNV